MLLCMSSTNTDWAVIKLPAASADTVVLGRASRSPGVPSLNDPAAPGLLSRQHCRLQLRPDGLVVVEDLKSLNHTYVEGPLSADGRPHRERLEPFVPRVLQPGDMLLLGGTDTVVGVNDTVIPNPFKFLFTPAVVSPAGADAATAADKAPDVAEQHQHQQVSCEWVSEENTVWLVKTNNCWSGSVSHSLCAAYLCQHMQQQYQLTTDMALVHPTCRCLGCQWVLSTPCCSASSSSSRIGTQPKPLLVAVYITAPCRM